MSPVDRDAWLPPPPRTPAPSLARVSAMYGSQLWDQPEHAAERQRVRDFLAQPGPAALEIGFDHGMVLLAQARSMPTWRWLGCEIRKARVQALLPHAPANCLPLRADARALLAGVIPPGSLQRIDALFPTPALDGKHLLFTPDVAALLARALAPGGRLLIRTDVPGYAAYLTQLFAAWQPAEPPSPATELSRRERICERDGLPIYTLCATAPPSGG